MRTRYAKSVRSAWKEAEQTSISHTSGRLLDRDITANEQILKEIFRNCSDVIFRTIQTNGYDMLLIYVDGLVNVALVDQILLKPFMNESSQLSDPRQIIHQHFVSVGHVHTDNDVDEVVKSILSGNLVLLAQDENIALIADVKGVEKRSIEEPTSEGSIRGAKDGFTETLGVNQSLIRRRLKTPNLKMESVTVGRLSGTQIVITYIEGRAPRDIVDEVRRRVQEINVDSVLGSGNVEEFIEDVPFSPFPQVQNTERPDVVCSSLLEGKVAILVENTPFVLIVPMTFWVGLQAAEDYEERFIYVTVLRFLRYSLFFVSLILPSLYVAVTTFHPQLLPTSLLISIASSREGVPFSAMVEALLMESMFEGLREAGIRLPKPVGSAVSIVGALVIGQAAVQAGIISAPMVIVVATTGIASFAIPRYSLGTAFRMLRFPTLVLSGTLGLLGMALALVTMVIHLVNLRSFGVPYLSPVAPQVPKRMLDVFVRVPKWMRRS